MTLTIVLMVVIVVCLIAWAVVKLRPKRPVRDLNMVETQEVQERLRSGDRVGAIRLIRQYTGKSLIAAREYADTIR